MKFIAGVLQVELLSSKGVSYYCTSPIVCVLCLVALQPLLASHPRVSRHAFSDSDTFLTLTKPVIFFFVFNEQILTVIL